MRIVLSIESGGSKKIIRKRVKVVGNIDEELIEEIVKKVVKEYLGIDVWIFHEKIELSLEPYEAATYFMISGIIFKDTESIGTFTYYSLTDELQITIIL